MTSPASTPGSAAPADLSPNQLHKRRQIVEAARTVLVRDGLAGCTVRAVADASPLTKSAIHYYFADMNDLIDEAMVATVEAFVAMISDVAGRQEDPAGRFWAAVREFFRIFEEMPGSAELWLGYWIESTRGDRLQPIDRMHRQVTEIFAGMLKAIPVDDPDGRAEILFAYLLGTVVQQRVHPSPPEKIRSQIAAICALG